MMNNLIVLTQALADYALLLTFQLALILMVRKPVLRIFGAITTYRLWLLPLLWAPLYFIDWSWLHPELVQSWVADTAIRAPLNMLSPALEWLPENLSGPLPTTLNESAGTVASARETDWQAILAGLWLTGVVILLARQGLSIHFFTRYINKHAVSVPDQQKPALAQDASISARVPLYTLAGLGTPALFGVVNPVLLLPEDFMATYDSDQRHLILSHEAVHLQRRDNLWNLFAWAFKVMFWFNPVAHLAYRHYRADQELSCDALALTHSNAGQRNRYARTLLESFGRPDSYRQSPLLSAWGSLTTLKERTVMIKRYSRCTSRPRLLRVALLALLLVGAGITALMTDTVSIPAQAAAANPGGAIPVDRAALSATVADAADRAEDLLEAREYSAAESTLNILRARELTGDLNAQERYLFWRLAGDLELARGNAVAAVEAYSAMLDTAGLSRTQREDAMIRLAEVYNAPGSDVTDYKQALALYQELAAMSDRSNPDHLTRIAETLQRLKQNEKALVAAQEAFDAYGDNAPRSAYQLLWRLTRDNAAKRQIHETLAEKFMDTQDIARLALFTRADGSYEPDVLGGCLILAVGGGSGSSGTCGGNGSGSIQIQSAAVTPDAIRFRPSAQPLAFVQPVYPEEARLNGIEGRNMIVLDLDETGAVSNAVIVDSTRDSIFDNATLAAIAQFRFDRTQIESNSAVVDLVYLFNYELPEQE